MKKVLIISVFCIVAASLAAQDVFTVPEPTVAQQHVRMLGQAQGISLVYISYAKSLGKSVEEAGTYMGNIFKTGWNKDNGFDGFVRGMLNNFTCFVPNNEIVILEQSDKMIKFRSKNMYPGFRKNGVSYGITYDEFMKSMEIACKVIGEYLGSEYAQEVTDAGTIITIKKK